MDYGLEPPKLKRLHHGECVSVETQQAALALDLADNLRTVIPQMGESPSPNLNNFNRQSPPATKRKRCQL